MVTLKVTAFLAIVVAITHVSALSSAFVIVATAFPLIEGVVLDSWAIELALSCGGSLAFASVTVSFPEFMAPSVLEDV